MAMSRALHRVWVGLPSIAFNAFMAVIYGRMLADPTGTDGDQARTLAAMVVLQFGTMHAVVFLAGIGEMPKRLKAVGCFILLLLFYSFFAGTFACIMHSWLPVWLLV